MKKKLRLLILASFWVWICTSYKSIQFFTPEQFVAFESSANVLQEYTETMVLKILSMKGS